MLPKNAQTLIDTAAANGWSYAVQWGWDSASFPFVTIDVADSDRRHYRITWHTRGTGSLRLFGRILNRGRDQYVSSLREVVCEIKANPVDWEVPA